VTEHKESILHAEKIVGNLLEAVISEANPPLQIHELLGDAVTMYAPINAVEITAEQLLLQMQKMREAFIQTEAAHVSDCSMCACEACTNVGKLKLKIIAHIGQAAFTQVRGLKKISGEDVILTHRWLKNTIPSKDYFLLTEQFAHAITEESLAGFARHQEMLEGLGSKTAYYLSHQGELQPPKPTFFRKLMKHTELNIHHALRALGKPKKTFLNLPV
jgi:hypothetical protein